jgi:hypothetical protein
VSGERSAIRCQQELIESVRQQGLPFFAAQVAADRFGVASPLRLLIKWIAL